MNKEQLVQILQACLLSYEGMSFDEMKAQGLEPYLIKIGERVCFNLQTKVFEVVK